MGDGSRSWEKTFCTLGQIWDLVRFYDIGEMRILFLLVVWQVVSLLFGIQERQRQWYFILYRFQHTFRKPVHQMQIQQILCFLFHLIINSLTPYFSNNLSFDLFVPFYFI